MQFLHSQSIPASLHQRGLKSKIRAERDNSRYDQELEQLFYINANGKEVALVPAIMRVDFFVEAHKQLGHVAHQ